MLFIVGEPSVNVGLCNVTIILSTFFGNGAIFTVDRKGKIVIIK